MAETNQQDVTQLEFHQAMNDFKNMFPEVEEDVIEAVLRTNNGVVDATIDQLLQMNTDSHKKKALLKQNKNYNRSNIYDSSSNNAKTCEKNLQFLNEKISKDSLRYQRRWDPPLLGQLSPTFLRVCLNETQRKLTNMDSNNVPLISSSFLLQKMAENERNRQDSSLLSDDPELAQFLDDERFAILLQNEEFVRELRLNRDFMSTLESDNGFNSGTHYDLNSTAANLDSDTAFRERLRNMGKMSKRKFSQLARLFSGRAKKNFRQLDDTSSKEAAGYYDDHHTSFDETKHQDDKFKKNNSKY